MERNSECARSLSITVYSFMYSQMFISFVLDTMPSIETSKINAQYLHNMERKDKFHKKVL